jgi:hypothetical protein
MRTIKPDVVSGALFICLGAAGLLLAWHLEVGAASEMGAGYFPRLVSMLLTGVGVLILIGALLAPSDVEAQGLSIDFRSVAAISLSLFAFAALLEMFGLIPTTAALLLIASLGSRELTRREFAVTSLFLLGFAVVVFRWGLGFQIPLWSW